MQPLLERAGPVPPPACVVCTDPVGLSLGSTSCRYSSAAGLYPLPRVLLYRPDKALMQPLLEREGKQTTPLASGKVFQGTLPARVPQPTSVVLA